MVQTHRDTERALAEMDERIARFGELGPDWDSYGAKAISPTVMAAAKGVLQTLAEGAAPPIGDGVLGVKIAPLPNGGILLEWHGRSADVEVEVTPTGALDLLVEERVGARYESSERADVAVEEIAALLDHVLAA